MTYNSFGMNCNYRQRLRPIKIHLILSRGDSFFFAYACVSCHKSVLRGRPKQTFRIVKKLRWTTSICAVAITDDILSKRKSLVTRQIECSNGIKFRKVTLCIAIGIPNDYCLLSVRDDPL